MAEKKFISIERLGLYDEKIKKVITDGDAATLQGAKDYADSLADNYDAAGTAASALADAKAYADGKDAAIQAAQDAADAAQKTADDLGDYVGEIPSTYTEATVIAYINKKAEETLASATGGSSESAASVLAALNTYKSENDPKVTDLQERMTSAEADITALQDIDHDAYKGADEQVLSDAKAYADGLAKNYDPAGSAAAVDAKLTAEVERATAAEGTNAAAAKAAQDGVDALDALIGDVAEGKTVVQMIADAKTAATYDDTQVKADIQANTDAIALLNDGSTVAGSVDYKIAQAVAAIMENPDETMNSINELVTWINGHAQDALELSNKVTANEEDIAALEGLVGTTGVAAQISAAIEEALKIDGVDKYALAADLTAAIGRIAAMEAKVPNWDAAEQNAKDYADGLNTAMGTRVKTIEDDYLKAADKTELSNAISGEIERATAAEAQALSDAKAYADGKDTAMGSRVTALEDWQTNMVEASEADINNLFTA